LLRAHLMRALHRWRFLLVFLLGLVPLQIAAGYLPDMGSFGVVRDGVCWSAGSPEASEWVALAKLAGIWLTMLLTVSLGLWFGLWLRNSLYAVLTTNGMLLAIMLIIIAAQDQNFLSLRLYDLLWTFVTMTLAVKNSDFFFDPNWTILNSVCIPIILVVPVIYLAKHHVRKAL
jgi:hypothetical protein